MTTPQTDSSSPVFGGLDALVGDQALHKDLLTAGYLVGVLATVRVGDKRLQRRGYRSPMLLGGERIISTFATAPRSPCCSTSSWWPSRLWRS
jgi:hypothetical protein